MSLFTGENKQRQYSVLSRIDLYFKLNLNFKTINLHKKLIKMGTATEILTTK